MKKSFYEKEFIDDNWDLIDDPNAGWNSEPDVDDGYRPSWD